MNNIYKIHTEINIEISAGKSPSHEDSWHVEGRELFDDVWMSNTPAEHSGNGRQVNIQVDNNEQMHHEDHTAYKTKHVHANRTFDITPTTSV